MSDCCGMPDQSNDPKQCPVCSQAGRPVSSVTLHSLLIPEALVSLSEDSDYRFCATRTCPVVYFGSDGQTFETGRLRVPVWQKTDDPNVPVCYCFGWTEARIRSEYRQAGKMTAVTSISSRVKAGDCACEVNNPQGSCCLGNVSQVVKRVSTDGEVHGEGALP